jgi:hypothetical protein
MNELQINYKTELENYRLQKTRYKCPFGEHFLPHLIPILGSIEPVKGGLDKYRKQTYSASATFKAIASGPDMISTPNGEIHKNTLGNLIMYLYEVPRSAFIYGSMSKSKDFARLGSYTPLLMYALKESKGIKYSEWHQNDPAIKFFLGKSLECVQHYKEGHNPFSGMPSLQVKNLREQALQKSQGVYDKVTSRTCRITSFTETEDGETTTFEFDKDVMRMALQLWIANSSLRSPGVMLLNPWNWDAVPDALDDTSIVVSENEFDLEELFGNPPVKDEVLPWS